MRSLSSLLLLLSACISSCSSARILAVLPFPSRSHHAFDTAILRALAARGHHLVEYSPFPPRTTIPNHTHFQIHTRFEEAFRYWTFNDVMETIKAGEPAWTGAKLRKQWELIDPVCEDALAHEKIQKLIHSDQKFDLVLTESTFGQESMLVFGHRFSAPTVTIECFFPWSILNWDAGNALSAASVPDLYLDAFSKEALSFQDRMLNFISISVSLLLYHFSHIPRQEEILKKYYTFSEAPPLNEMVSNVSLYLTNSHPTVVNFVHPYTPNIVPIGGINIFKSKTSQVPLDVLDFMEDAKDGFVLISLGTVVPVHKMPTQTLNIFINVFKKLPQKFIWLINLEKLPEVLPKNVMIKKWLPQIEILEHTNCELLITHGGLFSHHEALHTGVPTVNIPFLSDQPFNSRYRELRGIGVSLNIVTLSEESLHSAITTVLSDPRYKANAEKFSRVYRDRPMSPTETAVFWVEYVLRHQGDLLHLRPTSAHMTWYQLALLDVLGAVTATIFLSVVIFCLFLRASLRLFYRATMNEKVLLPKKVN